MYVQHVSHDLYYALEIGLALLPFRETTNSHNFDRCPNQYF